jgi:hypothetical protein
VGNLEKPARSDLAPLNFKVPVEFHLDFETYAAQRGTNMVDSLQQGCELLKRNREVKNMD